MKAPAGDIQQPQSPLPRTHAQQPRSPPSKGPVRSGELPSVSRYERRLQTDPKPQQRFQPAYSPQTRPRLQQQFCSAPGSQTGPAHGPQTRPMPQQHSQPAPRSQTEPAYGPQNRPMPQQHSGSQPAPGSRNGQRPYAPMFGPPCGPWLPHHMSYPPLPPGRSTDPRFALSNCYGLQPPPGWLQAQLHYLEMTNRYIAASLDNLRSHMSGGSWWFPTHMHNAHC